MTRKVNQKELKFIQEELAYHKEKELITQEQMDRILGSYQVAEKLNFIRVILLIGGFLIGLGILSFIASNWQAMGKILKLSLIFSAYIIANLVSHKLEDTSTKMSESFRIIGIAVYGAGIFLIGQMFNFGGHFSNAFLLWALGILPMSYLLEDRLIYLCSTILLFVYVNGYVVFESFPWLILPILAGLYYLNRFFNNWALGVFLLNLLFLNVLAHFIVSLPIAYIEDFFGLIFFAVGLILYYLPLRSNRLIFKLQGNLVFGITGVFLTFKYAWPFLSPDQAAIAAIVFAVVFVLYLLLLVKQENLVSLTFVCITIFRYYADTMYDFMPKSLFFISCGLLLLGFGYYVEKKRRRSGGMLND